MRRERDAAVVVAQFQIRMMVLDVRDMGHGIDEAHGAIKILELVRTLQAFRVLPDLPVAVQVPEQHGGIGGRQRRDSAFAGYAFLAGQFVHAEIRV